MAYTIEGSTSRCQSCGRPRISPDGYYTENTPTVYDVLLMMDRGSNSGMVVHICAECAGWIADDLKAQDKAREKQSNPVNHP